MTNAIQNVVILLLAGGLIFAALAIRNLSDTMRLVQKHRSSRPEGESDS